MDIIDIRLRHRLSPTGHTIDLHDTSTMFPAGGDSLGLTAGLVMNREASKNLKTHANTAQHPLRLKAYLIKNLNNSISTALPNHSLPTILKAYSNPVQGAPAVRHAPFPELRSPRVDLRIEPTTLPSSRSMLGVGLKLEQCAEPMEHYFTTCSSHCPAAPQGFRASRWQD
jgi:hypothetical protein